MQLSPLDGQFSEFGADTLKGFDLSNAQVGERIGGIPGRQMVQFYKQKRLVPVTIEAVKNPATGMSIPKKQKFEEVEYEMVRIVTPGDKNIFDDRVEEYHKRDFYQHYAAYKSGNAAPLGTDVENVDWIHSSVALELKYRGCHTVEQLADAGDMLLNTLPDGYGLRDLARIYCKTQQDNAQSGRIQALEDMIAQLKAQVERYEEKATAPEPKGKK